MVHQRQGLTFRLKAGNHFARVHAGLDDLQRHPPPHRPFLFRQKHHAKAPFADLLHQPVGTDLSAEVFRDGAIGGGSQFRCGRLEKAGHLRLGRD